MYSDCGVCSSHAIILTTLEGCITHNSNTVSQTLCWRSWADIEDISVKLEKHGMSSFLLLDKSLKISGDICGCAAFCPSMIKWMMKFSWVETHTAVPDQSSSSYLKWGRKCAFCKKKLVYWSICIAKCDRKKIIQWIFFSSVKFYPT